MSAASCSGCGAPSSESSRALAESPRQSLCAACVRRLARAGTERLTLVAASLVIGLSAAALLPLLFPWRGAALLGAGVAAAASLPFALLPLIWRRSALPRALRPSAAWPWLSSVLGCWLALLPLWGLYRARARILNLTEEPFWLLVDGRRVARVEPSSGESMLAGVELELPAGRRELRVVAALAPGEPEIARAEVLVEGGKPHLFAPASAGYCFQIERRSYGSAGAVARSVSPLLGETRFWVLPDGISWFAPNPEAGVLATSGGTLASVRQKRCAE